MSFRAQRGTCCRRSHHRIRTCIPVTLLKFFPRADRLHVRNPVNRQDAIEMINFMLEQFRKIALLRRVAGKRLPAPPA